MTILVSPSAVPHAASGERPQVSIVIVGHVDHGKSPLVGRLLHETGSLPDGKLEMLKAVRARRGMPFEWSFLLDALQTERDQGITIDTTQIRFRTPSRDIVLIDAPGHAEFLRNMITGASQADAAVLIIDALEGVRDQTRRHGYLLHLLGVKQVCVVINKMDRVDFSEARFDEIKREISDHLTGRGVTPTAVIPISARDGDGVAQNTPRIAWYNGPTVVGALDTLTPTRALTELPLRLPVQAIYKFDDRRIGTMESRATVVAIEKAVDPGELTGVASTSIARNHVGEIDLSLARAAAADPYADNPRNGRLVIEVNGRIAGGGLVLSIEAGQRAVPVDIVPVESDLQPQERVARHHHSGAVVWFTGLPGAGKSTLARALERRLFSRGGSAILLDGDTLRAGLNSDLEFSPEDRRENIRRLADVAAHLARNGHIAIVAAVSPAAGDRAQARRIAGDLFREIYVSTSAEVCESRDPKGHYAKARAGKLPGFTGTCSDYQPPAAAELVLDTATRPVSETVGDIERMLLADHVLLQEPGDFAANI